MSRFLSDRFASFRFRADLRTAGVGLQALLAGEGGDLVLNRLQGGGGVVGELGLLHEVVHAQGAGEPGGAAGGQGVVGPG